MFTGLVRQIGLVKSFAGTGGMARLVIGITGISKRVYRGDSVAVNGVCLTAAGIDAGNVTFDVMAETLERSTLRSLKAKDAVNIETALLASDPIGGHFVQGHIDCVGSVKTVSRRPDGLLMDIEMPQQYSPLVVEKGSIAVDGVSLTVAVARDKSFAVSLIPQTLKSTTLGLRRPGDKVNLEFDIIGKYIAKLHGAASGLSAGPSITEGLLKKSGFA